MYGTFLCRIHYTSVVCVANNKFNKYAYTNISLFTVHAWIRINRLHPVRKNNNNISHLHGVSNIHIAELSECKKQTREEKIICHLLKKRTTNSWYNKCSILNHSYWTFLYGCFIAYMQCSIIESIYTYIWDVVCEEAMRMK